MPTLLFTLFLLFFISWSAPQMSHSLLKPNFSLQSFLSSLNNYTADDSFILFQRLSNFFMISNSISSYMWFLLSLILILIKHMILAFLVIIKVYCSNELALLVNCFLSICILSSVFPSCRKRTLIISVKIKRIELKY